MYDLSKLNQLVLESTDAYLNIEAFGATTSTPYFINNFQYYIDSLIKMANISQEKIDEVNDLYTARRVNYGWYRGKGDSDQVQSSIQKMVDAGGLNSSNMTPVGLQELMKFYGVGVDCSGFVYQVLLYAFTQIGSEEEFKNSLNWADPEKQTPSEAGVSIFTGPASSPIPATEVQPLDIILIKEGNFYGHIGVFVEQDGGLYLAQSNINLDPTGVTLSKVEKTEDGINYTIPLTFGVSWNDLEESGDLVTHRLTILQ